MAAFPERGDVVWISTTPPHAGHEQAGRRPMLVLSPAAHNAKVGLAILCPITSQVKGYPFEVLLPAGIPVEGVVLSDQAKNLDWRARRADSPVACLRIPSGRCCSSRGRCFLHGPSGDRLTAVYRTWNTASRPFPEQPAQSPGQWCLGLRLAPSRGRGSGDDRLRESDGAVRRPR